VPDAGEAIGADMKRKLIGLLRDPGIIFCLGDIFLFLKVEVLPAALLVLTLCFLVFVKVAEHREKFLLDMQKDPGFALRIISIIQLSLLCISLFFAKDQEAWISLFAVLCFGVGNIRMSYILKNFEKTRQPPAPITLKNIWISPEALGGLGMFTIWQLSDSIMLYAAPVALAVVLLTVIESVTLNGFNKGYLQGILAILSACACILALADGDIYAAGASAASAYGTILLALFRYREHGQLPVSSAQEHEG
jgi:hypothetical protein